MMHAPFSNHSFDGNPIIPHDPVTVGSDASVNWLNSLHTRRQSVQDAAGMFVRAWSEAASTNMPPLGKLRQCARSLRTSHVGGRDTRSSGTHWSPSAYFIIPADDHIVIDDFSAANGDIVTFLGQFTSAKHLLRHIDVTVPLNGQNGDLIVTSEAGFRAIFLGAGGDRDQFVDSVIDFTPAGKTALAVADRINDADEAQIEAFLASLGTEIFETLFRGLCGALLLANLTAQSCALLLNLFDQEELANILGDIGSRGISMILAEMSEGELGAFYQNVGSEVMATLTTHMGDVIFTAISAGIEAAAWFWADGNELRKGFDETAAAAHHDTFAENSLVRSAAADMGDHDPLGDI